MTAPIVAVVIRKEHDVIAAFRDAGATSAARARPLHALSVDDGTGFRRLFARSVIREARPGAFYLDEDVLSAMRTTRRRMMVVMMALLAIIVIGLGLGMLPLR